MGGDIGRLAARGETLHCVHPERFLMIHHAGCFVRGERSSVMAMADVADVRSAQALGDGPRLAGGAAPGTGSR